MANWNDPQPGSGFGANRVNAGFGATSMDDGLRSYMLSIYNYMASGVLLTGLVAMLVANSSFGISLITSPMRILFMLAPLGFVMVMSFGYNRLSAPAMNALFWAYAAINGVSLSVIFMVYTGASIATTFFATAGAFAGLSLVGYTTKKNLSGFGSFLTMGLFGLIIAMLINMFLHNNVMQLVISVLGVLIFAGLTVWDTQKLKLMYGQNAGTQDASKMVVMGALTLYLDFINMFLFLLRFMGNRR